MRSHLPEDQTGKREGASFRAVNPASAAAQTYTYDSFGNIVATTGSLTNSFRYTGREFDTETSLYYYRARYYDQPTGRFLSEDPLGFLAGRNFYSYVTNDSLNFTDPLGLSQNDVLRILKNAQDITNQMTKNGERINNGNLNNLTSSLQRLRNLFFPSRAKPPLKGCGEQADTVTSGLQFPQTPYDDPWNFRVIPVNRGTHQIGLAHSGNPSDPDIIYDPWNNQFFTVPRGWSPAGPLSDP